MLLTLFLALWLLFISFLSSTVPPASDELQYQAYFQVLEGDRPINNLGEWKGLTLFSTLKSPINYRQLNALRSWSLLTPKPEVLIFVDKGDNEAERVVRQFHFTPVNVSATSSAHRGRPLMRGIIDDARVKASNNLLLFVNADIILFNDIIRVAQYMSNVPFNETFLICGKRWGVQGVGPIDFEDEEWRQQLKNRRHIAGWLDPRGWALDYLMWPKHLNISMPPFLVGRPRWDSWLLHTTIVSGIPVIDASEVLTVIHQDHLPTWNISDKVSTEMDELAGKLEFISTNDTSHLLLPCIEQNCVYPFKIVVRERPSNPNFFLYGLVFFGVVLVSIVVLQFFLLKRGGLRSSLSTVLRRLRHLSPLARNDETSSEITNI
jgi:hypothetical protein